MQLQGKVAIVTGGAVRIGRALSLALADAGMDVVVHHFHSEQQAQETVDQILCAGAGRPRSVPTLATQFPPLNTCLPPRSTASAMRTCS